MIHNNLSIPTIIGSSLGMIGGLMFMIVYGLIKEIRDSGRKFIFALSVCDFLLGFSAILPGPSVNGLCQFQSFFLSFSYAGSFCFIFLLALVYFLKIFYGKNVDESRKFFIIAIIVIVVFCLISSTLFVTLGKVGSGNTHWCWIEKHRAELVVYSIIWVCLFGTVLLYSILFFKIRKEQKYSKSFQYKIFALGWIYVCTELFPSIKRARQIANPDVENNLFLDVMQSLTAPMLGIWDAVFFVFADKNVRTFIKVKCGKPKKSLNLIKNQNILMQEHLINDDPNDDLNDDN
ncbi:g-protein coupled receptor protein [Anaeramoeba ignava]|uniref:G-protein coupled receptor protein n=1 Tax=Anaeramoeba ignava TaxID=1746090 RepID=A0A9Q0RBR7_ANAIG|nr:g-protein coupled receptor protein [Anaeramoeba ignava]